MKINILIFLLIILSSCKQLSQAYNGGNKFKKFTSKEIYLEESSRKINLNASKIIVLNDTNYKFLVNEIVDKKLFAHYGTVYKSNLYTADTEQMRECQGNYISIYRKIGNDDGYQKSEAINDPIVQSLNINKSKKTILFIYSYQMGRLAKRRITDLVKELNTDPEFDYFVLSMDNQDIKNK